MTSRCDSCQHKCVANGASQMYNEDNKKRGSANMEERLDNVPYIVHEAEMARMERVNKRQLIIIFVLLFIVVATNAGWIWHESQYIDESWTFEATTEGAGNAIANGNGEVYYYGESESNPQDQNP